MKKQFIKLSGVALIATAIALNLTCNKDKDKEKETIMPTLTVSTQEIVLGKTGWDDTDAPAIFEVNSSDNWILACTSWLTTSITEGNSGVSEILVTATEANEDREGYITVINDQNSDVQTVIKVTQVAEYLTPPMLTVSSASITVKFDGKTSEEMSPTVTITTNRSWTITGLPEWVTATPASGNAGKDITITLTVDINEQQLEREGIFVINAGTSTESFTITQLAEVQNLTVSTTSVEVDFNGKTSEGNSPTVTISTNKNWAITGLPEWVTATPASGNAGTNITITLALEGNDEGERNESFKINAGYLSEYVAIRQLKNPDFKDYPMIIGGTYFGYYAVTITQHATYWDIVTNLGTNDVPYFPLKLSELFPSGVITSCILEFDYQVSVDIPQIRVFFIWDTWDSREFGTIKLDATDDVDPNRNELWTKYSTNVSWATNRGWGVSASHESGFYFMSNIPCRMLIRNMRFKITLAD